MSNPFRTPTLVAVLFIGTFQFAAVADFTDDFESYTGNTSLPSPWTNLNRVASNTVEMIVTPDPSGYNVSGQGTSGQGGGAAWSESSRATGWDTGQTEFQVQWSARLLARVGAIPRLNLGVFNTLTGPANKFLYFEMNGSGNVIDIATSDGAAGQIAGILRDTWYRMTVTMTNNGGGSWSWSGDYEVDSGGSFIPAGSLGSGPLPAGFAPEAVDLNSITADIEGPSSSEMNAIDDVSFLSGPQTPPTTNVVESTDVAVTNAVATEFDSETDVVYELESTTDLIDTNTWAGTGAFVNGDGTTMLLFDPDTFSTSKLYRIVELE
jgi:hypothetical protein